MKNLTQWKFHSFAVGNRAGKILNYDLNSRSMTKDLITTLYLCMLQETITKQIFIKYYKLM